MKTQTATTWILSATDRYWSTSKQNCEDVSDDVLYTVTQMELIGFLKLFPPPPPPPVSQEDFFPIPSNRTTSLGKKVSSVSSTTLLQN